jgi:multiple sugar transport system ATP-binding protein
MAEIVLRDIEKYFGAAYVIRKLNLTIRHKEFVVLLGPSGCGKTTTLRAIAGLEEIDSGDILIDGEPVQRLEAGDRDIAFVFQLFALYPHLTAYENIAFPLRATRESQASVDTKVRQVARSLQVEHLLNKRPAALAGGDMQRVAIGRALVRRPKAMLMDEPIGALDAKLREEMRTELKRLHLENGSTTVYVTHDQVEAMSLADRIAIMNDGVLQQVGTPDDVYHRPANLFVAQFVGSPVMNIAPAVLATDGNATRVALGGGPIAFEFPAPGRL